MSTDKDIGAGTAAALVGAIGSAAVAAALLYVNHRKKKTEAEKRTVPSGEPPETD